jgi:hypothetical protein
MWWMSLIRAVSLCFLTIIAFLAVGKVSGSTVKGLWRLLTTSSVKEFLTSEGRLCLLVGALFGIFLIFYAFTPDFLCYLARMIDPKYFAVPQEKPPVVVWLLFFYFFGNIVLIGTLYRK